jgi:DNA polymerase-3 subunit delta'
MKFVDFIGNEKVKEQLTFLQESGRLPHAIVIEGEQGIGKRTLAREIALNLFCKSDGERPCRICPQCVKVIKQIHPDIYEYSASGGPRSFHVEVVRDVKEDVFVQPNEADYKVYILGNCQCMSESAQNAILKILEEPPEYALFILTTTTKSALLETVLSRSVVITLEGVESTKAAEYIVSKDESIDFNDASSAVAVWNGNIGKAIESLSDGKLSKISSIANDISLALLSDKEYDLLKACSVFERDRETLLAVLGLLKTIFRDALLYSNGSDVLSGQGETVKQLASRLNKEKLLKLVESCDNIRVLTEKNGNNAILITKICYEFRRAQGR